MSVILTGSHLKKKKFFQHLVWGNSGSSSRWVFPPQLDSLHGKSESVESEVLHEKDDLIFPQRRSFYFLQKNVMKSSIKKIKSLKLIETEQIQNVNVNKI